jgi:8-amino-7-oxononanoate synthase
VQASYTWGTGSTGSRLLSGNYDPLFELESFLSHRLGKACLLFNSGYHANTGLLSSLGQRGDLILADQLCHASLIDGARLSRAVFKRFRHNDYDHLSSLIHRHKSDYRMIYVVSESLFSMTGTVCDIAILTDIVKKTDRCYSILDESHAVGCYGIYGLGLAEATGLLSDVDIIVGTFGKAWASTGAFIGCSDIIKSYLVNCARSLLYSTALPPFVTAVNYVTVTHSYREEQARLHDNTATMYRQLAKAGYTNPNQTKHHIISLEATDVMTAQAHLLDSGVKVSAVRPPTVPQACLRLSMRSDHSPDDIQRLVDRLVACGVLPVHDTI